MSTLAGHRVPPVVDDRCSVTEETDPRSGGEHQTPGSRRRSPTLSTVTGAAFTLWAVVIGIQPLHDNSFLTHLATGRLIVGNWSIPRTDPYSFTARGEPWVVQSWLASLGYGVAERLAGLDGVRVLNAVLVGLLAALIWRLSRPSETLVPRIVIMALACGVGTGLWVERPLMIGLVCFASLMVLVEGRGDLRCLVPLMWIWVNSHGSFPLAVGLLVLLAIGRRLDGGHPERELRALGWTLAGCVLGAVNPLGPRLLEFPLTLVQKTESFQVIKEWKPPQMDSAWQVLFAVQVLVAVALFARRRSWRVALPLVVFVALAATSARNIVPASLVIVPGMAAGAVGLGNIDSRRRTAATRPALAGIVLLGLVLSLSSLSGPDVNLAAYPQNAVSWLDRQGLLEGRLVAPDYVGNYLEARYGAEANVFIDDRVDMYPEAVVQDSLQLLKGTPDSTAVLDRRRASVVLWPRSEPFARRVAADPRWTEVWHDDRWVVFRPT